MATKDQQTLDKAIIGCYVELVGKAFGVAGISLLITYGFDVAAANYPYGFIPYLKVLLLAGLIFTLVKVVAPVAKK